LIHSFIHSYHHYQLSISAVELQEGLLSLTAQRAACKTRILPIGGR